MDTDCEGIIKVEDAFRRCSRQATEGFPYCWRHGRLAHEAAGSLDTTGEALDIALLCILAGKGSGAERCDQIPDLSPSARYSIGALKSLGGRENGPSLGALEQPVEKAQMILSELSLPDLQNFKAVKSRAHSIVVSFHKYRNVIGHARAVVAALYRTELQSAFSISRINDVLTNSRCSTCDLFGGYLYLLGL